MRLSPDQPAFREDLRKHHTRLIESLLYLGERNAAAQSADELARFTRPTGEDLLEAARVLARCHDLAAQDERLSEDQRRQQAAEHARRAIELLTEARKRGTMGSQQVLAEAVFAPIRSRPDFQLLLPALGMTAPPPEK